VFCLSGDVESDYTHHLIEQINLPLDRQVGEISCRDPPPSCCHGWRPRAGSCHQPAVTRSGAHERAAARKHGQFQLEDEEKLPDWLADVAVVR